MLVLTCGLTVALMTGCREGGVPSAASASESPSLREISAARSRVVWVRDLGDGDDKFLKGKRHALMGLDSTDGQERVLWAPDDQIVKPIFAPDGSYVVVSRRRDDRMFRVAWSGGDVREVGRGFALAVWRDPATNMDWLYAAVDRSKNEDAPFKRIVRYPIDDPSHVETVWKRGDVSLDSVGVSRDGTRIGGMFPWPRGLIVDTTNGRATQHGRGCWSSLSPDNRYVLWVFDGAHRNLFFHTEDGRYRWRVAVNTIPGGNNRRVYHPRWSNHARYFTLTGPHDTDALGKKVKGAGKSVEVWVGRFSEDFSVVEAWARVTDNQAGDYFPDLWVEDGPSSEIPESVLSPREGAAVPPVALGEAWPGTTNGLVFVWADGRTRNEVFDGHRNAIVECSPEPVGGARFSRSFGMDLRRGAFIATESASRILRAIRESNEFTVEFLATARRDDLKGPARIVAFSQRVGDSNLMIGQEGRDLVLRVRTPETGNDGTKNDSQVTLGPLEPGVPTHWIIAYRPGELAVYRDGLRVEVAQKIAGDLQKWKEAPLAFGNEATGDRPWDGELEAVAIFNRFVGPDEAARRGELARSRLAGRPPAEVLRVRARLVEKTPTPDLAAIAPYRRALGLFVYELEPNTALIDGSERIQVYHWLILDGTTVSPTTEIGGWADLVLERSETRPELESERRIVATDAFDLPEFLDVAP